MYLPHTKDEAFALLNDGSFFYSWHAKTKSPAQPVCQREARKEVGTDRQTGGSVSVTNIFRLLITQIRVEPLKFSVFFSLYQEKFFFEG